MSATRGDGFASAQAVAEICAINYWVPHSDHERGNASLFQNFLPGVLSTTQLYERIVAMPFDIRELFASRSAVLTSRMHGLSRTRVIPISISTLEEIIPRNQALFNVVVSNESVVSRVSRALESSRQEWLHISTSPEPSATPIGLADDELFVSYFRRVGGKRAEPAPVEIFREFLESPSRAWSKLSVDCPSYAHNLTRPNELALAALRIELRGTEAMGPHAPNLYVSGTVRSASVVERMRASLTVKHGLPVHENDLTLSVESVGWGMSSADLRERVIEAGASQREARLVQAIVHRSGYVSEIPAARPSEILGEFAQAAIATRRAELEALTSALVLHSGTRLSPVLRLNPGLNAIRPSLVDIGNCARGSGPHQSFKLNKLGRRLSDAMADVIGSRVVGEIRGSAKRMSEVSIVADLPLEWLSIDGIPLGMKHDVSRVPCNPGNVMFSQCANNDVTFVSRDSFDEILVVRSFRKGDPIATHLENALSKPIGETGDRAAIIRFVDVSTPSDFVQAVSGFKGAMLVFDGHGSRDSFTGVGSIIVGGKPLDVWSLRKEIVLPPIVLLSACDTYPIDGSHGSSAVGMLALGARTVLGTLLPIHSVRACALLARLIYRLNAFLPLVMKRHPNGVNWRFIMSGMLRMVYASEVIYAFAAAFRLEPVERAKIQYEANTDINLRNPRWLDQIHKRLAVAAHISVGNVIAYCNRYAWITEALKYVQLGRPELVHVVSKVPAESWLGDDAGNGNAS